MLSAKTRVEVLLDSGRQKQPFTHFLSVPLTDKHIQGTLADFKTDILRECDGVGTKRVVKIRTAEKNYCKYCNDPKFSDRQV